MVDLSGYAPVAYLGVERVGHVEHGRAGCECKQFAFGRKHHNLARKEIEFECIEKVDGIWVGVIKYILDGAQPHCQLTLFLRFTPDFIFPMGGKSLFGNLVHAARAYLHLYPVAVGPHQCDVQSLIAIGLGHSHPVAYSLGMRCVQVGQRGIDAITHLLLSHPLRRVKDDTHGIKVIDLLKRYALGLHLAPYRIYRFQACFRLIFQAHPYELLLYRLGEVVVDSRPTCLGGLDLVADTFVSRRMLILEAEILKLGLDGEKPQSMGQRRIYI